MPYTHGFSPTSNSYYTPPHQSHQSFITTNPPISTRGSWLRNISLQREQLTVLADIRDVYNEWMNVEAVGRDPYLCYRPKYENYAARPCSRVSPCSHHPPVPKSCLNTPVYPGVYAPHLTPSNPSQLSQSSALSSGPVSVSRRQAIMSTHPTSSPQRADHDNFMASLARSFSNFEDNLHVVSSRSQSLQHYRVLTRDQHPLIKKLFQSTPPTQVSPETKPDDIRVHNLNGSSEMPASPQDDHSLSASTSIQVGSREPWAEPGVELVVRKENDNLQIHVLNHNHPNPSPLLIPVQPLYRTLLIDIPWDPGSLRKGSPTRNPDASQSVVSFVTIATLLDTVSRRSKKRIAHALDTLLHPSQTCCSALIIVVALAITQIHAQPFMSLLNTPELFDPVFALFFISLAERVAMRGDLE